MKAKVERGSGFRGVANYILDEGKDAKGDKLPEIVGGTIAATDAKGMSREFAVTRRLRPDIERPVWHCSLSLPPGDRLDSDRWDAVATDFMKEMGFPDDTLYTVVRHSDMEHDHVHIVASRVSMSGQVWHGKHEAFEAINATQRLEQRHGLTLTPGLGNPEDERTPRPKLTTQELSKAERTGVQPAKLVIFDAITRRLKAGKQTLTEFIKRLRDDDVHVVPKVASQTGKLQGLSFEHEGLVFAGGKLATGHSYTLGNLKKKGVSYEPSRDDEAVADAVRAARERAASREDAERSPEAVGPDQEGDGQLAPGGRDGAGDSDETGRDDGPEPTGPAQDPKRPGGRDPSASPGYDNEDGRDVPGHSGSDENPAKRPKYTGPGSGISSTDQENTARPDMENHTTDDRQQPTIKRPSAGGGWNARFKKASAAKRAAAQPAGRRVAESEIATAQQIDPTPMLEGAGFVVRHEGRHLSVRHPAGDEVYRITKMPDGRYISCDRYQNGIGDNIALARDLEPGLSFPDAVYRLTGGQSMQEAVTHAEKPPIAPPRLPRPSTADVAAGRKYLQGRGIDAQTLAEAEKAGFLRYAPGAVVYVGQDKEGKVRAATRRAVDPADPVQKRDFKGTNKYYPGILPGSPRKVVIVEGGADALAVHTMARRRNQEPPTVIVSGGSNVLSFLKNQETQRLLMQAETVTITTEREKNAQVQAEVDAARAKQIREIQSITRAPVSTLDPAPGCKDVSEQNQLETEKAKADNQKVVEVVQTTPPPAAPPTPPASRYSNFSRPKG